MNFDLIKLLGSWTLFAFIHSLFANRGVKSFFQAKMGAAFQYYRLGYSIIAILSLTAVLIFQFSIPGAFLFHSPELRFLAGVPMCAVGLVIMKHCVDKYFRRLSGVQLKTKIEMKLETYGIHQFVRHPLYLGTLIFVWALFILLPSAANATGSFIITSYTLIGMKSEEEKLVKEYGQLYVSYRSITPALIPKFTVRLFRALLSDRRQDQER